MRPVLLLVGTAVLSLGPPSAAADDALVYPVGENVAGQTNEQLAVAWFRWAYGIKKDRSPITDKTGEFAGEGQAGPVWFLGGNFGGTTKRKITVPAGRAIVSPVIYSIGGAKTKSDIDRVADVVVTLDGKSVGNLSKHRVAPAPFEFAGLGADSVHPALAGKKTVTMEGHWFALKPLSPGEHTLRIKGRVKAPSVEDEFELDLTYQIRVEAGK